MEIEEIAGEMETEVKERVVFAAMEREVWSNGQMRGIKRDIRKVMITITYTLRKDKIV